MVYTDELIHGGMQIKTLKLDYTAEVTSARVEGLLMLNLLDVMMATRVRTRRSGRCSCWISARARPFSSCCIARDMDMYSNCLSALICAPEVLPRPLLQPKYEISLNAPHAARAKFTRGYNQAHIYAYLNKCLISCSASTMELYFMDKENASSN
jgi:hypothetical protein